MSILGHSRVQGQNSRNLVKNSGSVFLESSDSRDVGSATALSSLHSESLPGLNNSHLNAAMNCSCLVTFKCNIFSLLYQFILPSHARTWFLARLFLHSVLQIKRTKCPKCEFNPHNSARSLCLMKQFCS